MPNFKYDRLAGEIQKTINNIINTKIDDLEFVTVTEVEITKDLGDAKIYVQSLSSNSEDYIIKILKEKEKMIKRLLAESVQMRRIPNLIFHYDHRLDNYNKIDEILKNDKKN